MDLLAEQSRVGLIPALILFHPSAEVVLRALELFSSARREDYDAIVPRLRSHPDPRIRAAALRAAAAADEPGKLLDAMGDPSPIVRATALVGLAARAGAGDGELERQFRDVVEGSSAEAQLALAQAIRARPAPVFEGALPGLARSPHLEVRRETVRAMSALTSETFLAPLVALLAEQTLRADVRRALVAHGQPALRSLARTLADESQPQSVRRHVPKAIAAFRSEAAASELTEALARRQDGLLRFSVLSALGSLRRDRPGLALDPVPLGRALEGALADSEALMRARRALGGARRAEVGGETPAREALAALLRHKQQHAVERCFRLLNLLHPSEDILRAYRALESEAGDVRSRGRELAEHVIAPEARPRLLPVIDDLYETGSAPEPDEPEKLPDDGEVLRDLLEGSSDSLAALAAYHAGELGLTRLRPQLTRLRDAAPPPVAEVAAQALDALPAGTG